MTTTALPNRHFLWIAAALLVAALPHAGHLPLWVAALVPAAIALRLGLGRPPGRWLLVPLVVAVFVGVIAQYRAISGPDAGGAFFTAMVALKFLEARSTRDAGLLICLAWFQATAIFLYSEAIGMAVYVIASFALTTVALMTVIAPDGPSPQRRMGVTTTLLLQALPIMLVLFVLFPRIPGPLWSLHDDTQARSGLSDSMSPGQIADLALSYEVAFRVEFDGEAPASRHHYWRGPVFAAYDGETWRESEYDGDADTPALATRDTAIDYTLTLEAHRQRWLFALDMPADERPRGTEFNGARQLLTEERVRATRRFELSSHLDYRLEPDVDQRRREEAMALPDDAAPRARELASELRAEAGDDDAAMIDHALEWFRAGDFEYTLSPEPLDGDATDEFLFDTRSGFCEHFASAFAILLRAADIPTRVVTGYLGSEPGGPGDYFIVRQSDAHAWVEVWLADEGWVRVDPTATVSPDRINLGLGGIPGTEDLIPDLGRGEDSMRRRIALTWDAVNHGWNRFVLGYGPDLQERLLDRLGLEHLGRYALGVLSIAIAGLLVVAIWLLGRGADRPRDTVERAWRAVERRLRRQGVVRAPDEGVYAFCQRAARERPDLAPALTRLADLHDHLRYRPAPDAATRQQFVRAARAFRARPGQTASADTSERPLRR